MSSRLTDRDLEVLFVDKEALAEAKAPFMIADYAERISNYKGKARPECVFTIYLIDGPERGIEQLLTLGVTAPRQKIGKLIKQSAPRGPVRLEMRDKSPKGVPFDNPLYVFVPETNPEVLAIADKLVKQLAREALDTSRDQDE